MSINLKDNLEKLALQENPEHLDSDLIIDIIECLNKDLKIKLLPSIFNNKNKISNYKIISTLAKGGYGEVFIAKDLRNNKIVAIKRTSKDLIKSCANSSFFMHEKEIITKKNKYLVNGIETMQDDIYLYFIMEYVMGGDLMGYLSKEENLTEKEIKFYAAEILVALNELHEMGYIHRDLKPDNILINKEGHIRIADFGTACKDIRNSNLNTFNFEDEDFIKIEKFIKENKNVKSKVLGYSKTPLGTPDYVCKDLLIEAYNFYDETVDFWSLGVILYEMKMEEPPFYTDSLRMTYQKIINIEYKELTGCSEEFKDLIKKLLSNKDKRLSFEEIKKHSFFKEIDFNNLERITPPFIPEIESDYDKQNFLDTEFIPNESKIYGGYNDFIGFTSSIKKKEINLIKKEIKLKNKEIEIKKKPLNIKNFDHLNLINNFNFFFSDIKKFVKDCHFTLNNLQKMINPGNFKIAEKNKDKKMLRVLKTEVKEYQMKIENEILQRKKLEDEIFFLRKILNKNVIKKASFNLISLTNEKFNIFINNNNFIVNNEIFDIKRVIIKNLKNNELFHLSNKRRSLALKIHIISEKNKDFLFLKKSKKQIEKEIRDEKNILKGLRDLINVMSGEALNEIYTQKNIGEKRIYKLLEELKNCKDEGEEKNLGKFYEFENHLFFEKTVPKGTLCENCNEILFGKVNQSFCCKNCNMLVHKHCYVLIDTSCETNLLIKQGKTHFLICDSISDKEKLLQVFNK